MNLFKNQSYGLQVHLCRDNQEKKMITH